MDRRLLSVIPYAVAAACLVLAQFLPIMGAEAHVTQYNFETRSQDEVQVSDAVYTVWGVSDGIGPQAGTYRELDLSVTDPRYEQEEGEQNRGDLAPYLGPATLVVGAMILIAAGSVGRLPWRWAFGIGVATTAAAIVGLAILIDDVNGIPPRLAAVAQESYGPSSGGGFSRTPNETGFVAIIGTQVMTAIGTLALFWQRRAVDDGSPLPALSDT